MVFKNLQIHFNSYLPIMSNLKSNSPLYIRFSMFVMTWLKYLSSLCDKSRVSLKFVKSFSKKILFSTAPMAHKTRSQERFFYKSYNFVATIKNNNLKGVNILHVMYQNFLVSNFVIPSTNLMQIRKFIVNTNIFSNNLYDEIGRHARLKTLSFLGPGSSPGIGNLYVFI